MKILRITTDNLNSLYGNTTINLEQSPLGDTGLYAITGDTGAGKSTILDAITLALYGKIPRNTQVTEVMSYGTAECTAEVYFRVQDNQYFAVWSLRRARGKVDGNLQTPEMKLAKFDPAVQDYKIIEDRRSKVPDLVSEITGLDFERFTRSVMLAQGDFAAFLNAKPNEQSDLLERITGTEIYSLISQAAHNRHRFEKQQYELLNKLIGDIELLSDETRQSYADKVSTLQKEKEKKNNTRKSLDESQQFLKKLNESLNSLNTYSQKERQITDELEDRKQEFDRYKQHVLASPAIPLLKDRNENTAALLSTQQTLASDTTELKAVIGRLDKAEQEHIASEQKLQSAKNDLLQWKPKIKLAQEVIQTKETAEQKLSEARASARKLIAEMDLETKKQTTLKQQQSEARESKKQVTQWLQRHEAFVELPEAITQIEVDVEQLVETEKNLTKSVKSLHEERAKQSEIKKQINLQQAEIIPLREEYNRLKLSFHAETGSETTKSRHAIYQAYSERTSTLKSTSGNIDLLLKLHTAREESAQKINHKVHALDQLVNQISHLEATHNVQKSLIQQLRENVEDRSKIVEQQQKIVNYEQDRQRLTDGDPCPLCGAIHHPYRVSKDGHPLIDLAKEELENARAKLKEAEADEKSISENLLKVQYQRDSLTCPDGTGSLDMEHKELAHLQQQLDEKLNHPDFANLPSNPEEWPSLKERLDKDWQSAEAARTRIQQTYDRLNDLDNQLVESERKLNTLETNLQTKAAGMAEKEDRQRELQEETTRRNQKLQNWLTIFPINTDDHEPSGLLSAWKQLAAEMTAGMRKNDALSHELAVLEPQLNSSVRDMQRMNQELQALTKQGESAKVSVQGCGEKLQALVGDRNPVTLEQELEKLIDIASDSFRKQSEAVTKLRMEKTRLEAQIQSQQKTLAQLQQRKEDLQAALHKTLQNTTAFDTIAELEQAILSEEDAKIIGTAYESLTERLEMTRSHLQRDQQTIEALKREKPDWDTLDLEQITSSIVALDAEIEQALIEEGGLIEKLENDQSNREKRGEKLKELELQKQELERWHALKELIGQSNGQKFRNYAQGLTLSRLVQLANAHLGRLSGRYRMRKKPDQHLELEIIDDHQAGNTRSMNTLSGGETFLVSLALALGLSDMASRTTTIQSLFIDEGFGTLDETTLDAALTTLENLQGTGKSIGIISHVPALKERIGTRIHVAKQSSGRSRVEIRNS